MTPISILFELPHGGLDLFWKDRKRKERNNDNDSFWNNKAISAAVTYHSYSLGKCLFFQQLWWWDMANCGHYGTIFAICVMVWLCLCWQWVCRLQTMVNFHGLQNGSISRSEIDKFSNFMCVVHNRVSQLAYL